MTTSTDHDQSARGRGAPADRPLALITGVGRTVGIGAGIARRLAASGWDIAFTYWTPYDDRMSWGSEPGATEGISQFLAEHGAFTTAIEADLADPDTPARVFDELNSVWAVSPRW
ncbi:short-chain dehydrogenase/reductase SDR [Actinobacteria bacterium OV320]|nr:short-chain dehydrogenase/reductase SDR [Actinobacteria bacterium OV320]